MSAAAAQQQELMIAGAQSPDGANVALTETQASFGCQRRRSSTRRSVDAREVQCTEEALPQAAEHRFGQ
jgi:hypothetical protein